MIQNSSKVNPAFDKILARIPPEIAATLTNEQLEAIEEALSKNNTLNHHPVDIRVSLPVPGRRTYIVLLAGSERRHYKRLRVEKLNHQVWTPVNITILVFFALLVTGFTSILYNVLDISNLPRVPFIHPVTVPWLSNKNQCEDSGKTWRDGECLDFEHDPSF